MPIKKPIKAVKLFKPKKKKILSRCAKRRIYMPKHRTAGMIQIGGRTYKVGSSKIENQWLDVLHVVQRQKVVYGFKGKVLVIDGMDENKKIAYEMLGGYCHGSHKTYPKNRDIKTWLGKTPNEMYFSTIARFNFLFQLGYSVFFVWDYDFKNKKTYGRLYKGPGDNLY